MNNNDFRYMRRGKQLSDLAAKDIALLQPIDQRGTGSEKALLILHGFSSSPAVYRYLIPQITHYDAIVCPVLPGHGKSIASFAQVKAADWVLAVKNACEPLVNQYKKVDVLGLSLGGLLACILSQHYALNHLYLLAPALKLKVKTTPMLQLAKALKYMGFHQLRNASGNLLNNERAELTYKKLPINAIIEMLQLAQNYQWVAPTCPVDVFLGAHDLVVSSEEVEQLFAPLPNATIHWLKNSAHVLPLDNDVEEIIQCINLNN